MDTFTWNLTDRLQRFVVWIYVPISPPDRILALGIRKALQSRALSVLIRTALIGDIFVGSRSRLQVEDKLLAGSAPLTMVYGEPREGDAVRFFGAYCDKPFSDQTRPPPFLLIKRGPCPITGAYFSWAALHDVSSTLVFYDKATGYCRGILFRYQNQGLRAVGQCRLQVDPAESIIQPLRLCFRAQTNNVQVQFKHTEMDGEGWESRPMKGLVKFWFTPESSFPIVEN